MKIIIDHRETEVMPGTTVMDAAASIGIKIPSMCFLRGHSNHPSCMVCMVEDEKTGKLFPSCAMPVSEGMRIITDSEVVRETRRESLELLLSDHRGDCEAPCRLSCPAFMNIPLMNRIISQGDPEKALEVVRQHIAIPLILGYICSAPCEKACHRKDIDGAVKICMLKQYTAGEDRIFLNLPQHEKSSKKVAIIGAGPAGLSAAFYLLKNGHDCFLIDKNEIAGGALNLIDKRKLPNDILEKEIEVIRKMGGKFILNKKINLTGLAEISNDYDAVVVAIGFDKDFQANNLEKVFICGNPSREEKMAVRSAAKGRETAEIVHNFIISSNLYSEKPFNASRAGKLSQADQLEYLKESSFPASTPDHEFVSEFDEAKRCMHCDCRKPVDCKLRKYSAEYKTDRKRFAPGYLKNIQKHFHDIVVYEPQKCIRCGLCVPGLAFFGRGYDVEIGVPLNSSLTEALNANGDECIICPTGALSYKK